MRGILLLLMLATTCYATCPDAALVFRNSEWVANNLVVKLFNFFYDTIGLTASDSCSPPKRFMSIFSLIKTIYLTTNCTDPGEAVAIARTKAKKQLKGTAAGIAGTFRGAIRRILNVIEQPLTDILTACGPETHEDECQTALKDIRTKREKQCKGYSRHTDYHKRVIQWAGNQKSIAYIDEVITRSTKKFNDTEVFDIFENLAITKYKDTFKELRNLFMAVKGGGFNCNVLSFTNSVCA